MTKDEVKYQVELAKEAESLLEQSCIELEQDLQFARQLLEERKIVVENMEKHLSKMED